MIGPWLNNRINDLQTALSHATERAERAEAILAAIRTWVETKDREAAQGVGVAIMHIVHQVRAVVDR